MVGGKVNDDIPVIDVAEVVRELKDSKKSEEELYLDVKKETAVTLGAVQ